jgi:hypothetical protein
VPALAAVAVGEHARGRAAEGPAGESEPAWPIVTIHQVLRWGRARACFPADGSIATQRSIIHLFSFLLCWGEENSDGSTGVLSPERRLSSV